MDQKPFNKNKSPSNSPPDSGESGTDASDKPVTETRPPAAAAAGRDSGIHQTSMSETEGADAKIDNLPAPPPLKSRSSSGLSVSPNSSAHENSEYSTSVDQGEEPGQEGGKKEYYKLPVQAKSKDLVKGRKKKVPGGTSSLENEGIGLQAIVIQDIVLS